MGFVAPIPLHVRPTVGSILCSIGPSALVPSARKSGILAAMSQSMDELALGLFDAGAIRFGSFVLKSGITSPIYVDLRVTVSYPDLLQMVAKALLNEAGRCKYDLLCGVPYTALPFATAMSLQDKVPMVMRRKEAKSYGTKKLIEGAFRDGQKCLVVEDLVTSGLSVLETVEPLKTSGLEVTDVVVLLDREQGGRANLESRGMALHSAMTLTELLDALERGSRITSEQVTNVQAFVAASQVTVETANNTRRKSYSEQLELVSNSCAQRLLAIMLKKETNLCVSADVTTVDELISLAESVGDEICCLKTHCDIIRDWDQSTGSLLRAVADQKNFLIFEDRKFADIGNTVLNQCLGGVYQIASWAHFVNAHSVPGPGVIDGIEKAAEQAGRELGVLLLAQMSSKGNLAVACGDYCARTVDMAKTRSSTVFGFVSQSNVGGSQFLHFTPGVQIVTGADDLGQQYNTPQKVIKDAGCDIIIVGRGIYQATDPKQAAVEYRKAGWQAYLSSLEFGDNTNLR